MEIRALKPRETPYKIRVARGLFLHVHPNGSKLWRYRYNANGTDHTLSFGPYPHITLAEATRRAKAAQDGRLNGYDPASDKRASEVTLEAVALEWWAKQRPRWRDGHAEIVLASLKADVFSTHGNAPIDHLTPPDVLKVIRSIESRSVDLGRRMRQRLDAIYGYAIAAGYARDNPAAHIINALAPAPRSERRPAILEIDQAREMLRRVESAPGFPVTKLANRFLAVTAVRLSEMRLSTWNEFSGDTWTIPAERMKIHKEHRVPLSPAAIEIIQALRPLSGHCPYPFVSSKGNLRPMGDTSIGNMLNINGYQGRHCAHGWRSTFSTCWNERGGVIADQPVSALVEHALAHSKNNVTVLYNRGTLFDARRVLMQMWADIILDGALPLSDVLAVRRH